MKKIIIISSIIILTTILAFVLMPKSKVDKTEDIIVEVEKGQFSIDITTTGELEAKNSERIIGPTGLRNLRIQQIKITEMIDEGTVVDSGDFVASLDPTEINDKLKDIETELEKFNSQYTTTALDTALELKQAREEIQNYEYAVEERTIELEQSQYEPPAVIRRTEIDLEKSKRALSQGKEKFLIKQKKAKARMREVGASLSQTRRKHNLMTELLSKLSIKAPKPGMLIYRRSWGGEKVKAGSTINSWDNTIALLPDLSIMVSKTFINEIDISKVKEGQIVEIGIDAFPDVEYKGVIESAANIGQELSGSDAKVFEVVILIDDVDSLIKPAMTTQNRIIIQELEDVVHIPLEAVHRRDSTTFVYIESGFSFQATEVILGATGTDDVVIKNGLVGGERIYISLPQDSENSEIKMIEKI